MRGRWRGRGRSALSAGAGYPTPSEMLAIDTATLRAAGLSNAKAGYVHDLAARVHDGRLDVLIQSDCWIAPVSALEIEWLDDG